jgi:hypothetical protein
MMGLHRVLFSGVHDAFSALSTANLHHEQAKALLAECRETSEASERVVNEQARVIIQLCDMMLGKNGMSPGHPARRGVEQNRRNARALLSGKENPVP